MSKAMMRVGSRGRVVLPAELRRRRNWVKGTVLVAVETDDAVLLLGRDELEGLVRDQLAGSNPVADLIGERRQESSREDTE